MMSYIIYYLHYAYMLLYFHRFNQFSVLKYGFIYPWYQRCFLAGDGKLRFVGPKAEDMSGEDFTETGNRA